MLDATNVYELLKKIPKGKVTTYGEIAKKLKSQAFREVGRIVGLNPNAPQVPCHRVVRSDGGISGYAFGVDKKIQLLKSEGIEVLDGKIKDFNEKLFTF
ncbi:MAG: MGMT family protein [Rickettsiales bacterium]|nr:MGMT family protein [Rickettsiales bacterium]